MTYAVSDIHGCYDKYAALLERLDLKPEDTLYVLGDVIDRGPDGFKIMLDMARRPNVVNLMGNHEDMAMQALPGIFQVMGGGGKRLGRREQQAIELWFYNGGELSLADFLWLDNEQERRIWDYMRAMPLYQELEVNGRQFLLLHGGLKGFSPTRPLDDYTPREILWCRPEEETLYFPDRYVIFGHTPVQLLDFQGKREEAPAEFYHGDHYIDIDCGCVFWDGRLGCLCLDTMEEIYV